MKEFMFFIIIFLLIFTLTYGSNEMKLNTSRIADFVKVFVNSALKKNEMQEYIWSELEFERVTPTPDKDDLKQAYSELLNLNSDILYLKQAALSAFNTKVSPYPLCCKIDETAYNRKFKQNVDIAQACELVAKNTSQSPFRLAQSFKTACSDKAKSKKQIRWMYFASNEGVTTVFPSASSLCNARNSRFRPWFLQTLYPFPKLVMIVIDKSASMRKIENGASLLDLAKLTAKAIIALLNPYDQFTVIAFANRPETQLPTDGSAKCIMSKLLRATYDNKQKSYSFIDLITAKGGSYYIKAVDRTFDFLRNKFTSDPTAPGVYKNAVIHFLSYGSSDDSENEIYETIQRNAVELNHRVVLMTYGLGGPNFDLLRNMVSKAKANYTNVTGEFNVIDNAISLKSKMAGFFHKYAFKNTDTNSPVWSFPYLDEAGLGQVMTLSLPVYKNSAFIGVVGLDISMNDIFSLASHYKPDELAYSFVVRSSGHVLYHPLIPYPDDHDALLVDVSALEKGDVFLGPYDGNKSNANTTANVTVALPQGSSRRYGVKTRQFVMNSAWYQIPSTDFVFAFRNMREKASAVKDTGSDLETGTVLYHRFDVIPPKKQCMHVNSLASVDRSSVFLAARAFANPDSAAADLTPSNVKDISRFLEKGGLSHFAIKESIRKEILATQKAEELWLTHGQNDLLKKQVIWRYLATKNGAQRVFPGTQLPFDYDAVRRSWYEQAVANRNKSVITAPYKDAATGVAVITFSHALLEQRYTGQADINTMDVFAVMGVDFLVNYFYEIFLEMYPVCQRTGEFKCLMIDSAGFVILTEEYTGTSFERDLHLAEIEPQVTSILIKHNVLKKIKCANIESALLQRTYRISDTQDEFWGTYGQGFWNFFGFKLLPVPGTNAFLIIRSVTDSACVNVFKCHCQPNVYSKQEQCKSTWSDRFCECPCPSENPHYDPCDNVYDSGNADPCTPERPSITPFNVKHDLSSLPNCYNISFERFIKSEQDYTYHFIGGACASVVFLLCCCLACARPSLTEIKERHKLKMQEVAMESLRKEFDKQVTPNDHEDFVHSNKLTRLFSKLKGNRGAAH